MKTIFLSVVFFLISIIVFAQEKAHINFDVTKYNFGTIYNDQDSVVSVKFHFENTGNAPFVIQKVTSSCGCAASEWTKSPVEKNQKGFVKVVFHSKGIIGKFSKSIYVKSDAENDVVILKIEGEVREKKKRKFNIFT